MPPTSKKLMRHIGLGLSVDLSVHLSVTLALGQEPLEIGSWNLVCETSMKIKESRIFFLSIAFVILELLPFSMFFVFITL